MCDSDAEKKFSGENLRHRDEKNGENSRTNAEYFKALEKWLNDVRSCQYCFFPGFPYTVMGQQMSPQLSQNSNSYVPPVPPVNQTFGMFTFPTEQQQPQPEEGVEYRIPPLWKRLLAETIDFIILFLFKLAATLIIVDYFDFVSMERFESFHQLDKLNIQLALDVSTELISIEVGHKVFVCLYEVYYLYRSTNNQVGGATPGKVFLGIRVVFCNKIEAVENRANIVKVTPATNLTFGWALARALLKNLLVALLLPICFPFFLNKHNRTIYDILCHSVVVEEKPIRDR